MQFDVNFIERLWGFSNVSINQTMESKGNRSISIIKSNEGRFVLKAFDPSLTEEGIKRNTFALSYLAQQNYLVSPKILRAVNGEFYTKYNDRFMYIMEYVEGEPLKETIDDEYLLGQASASLHRITDYPYDSGIDVQERIEKLYNRFHHHPFKREYDDIVNSLPNFNLLRQTFIHTDIGPHNALKLSNGRIVFVDWDDAGNGSIYIDIGYPLITQFVRYERSDTITFNLDHAKAFYNGYFSKSDMNSSEMEFIFHGAVFMQLMYMPSYGEEGIQPMWNLLKYAVAHKEKLLSAMM